MRPRSFLQRLEQRELATPRRLSNATSRIEGGTAALLGIVACWLHLTFATSAGGLWRDEANSVGVSTLPSLADVWRNLGHDSFPIFWHLVARAVARVAGPENEHIFRIYGFLIGVAIIVALWLNARAVRQTLPLISLALLGLSPAFIIWGDSFRGHGLGILLILTTCTALWRFIERPSRTRFLAVLVASLLSVHTLFQNAILLLAFGAGAVTVCARRREWRTAVLVLLCGAIAGLSLLPYQGMVSETSAWNMLVRIDDYTVLLFVFRIHQTLSSGGFYTSILWLVLLLVGLFVGLREVVRRTSGRLSPIQIDVCIFALVALAVGIPAFFIFLDRLSYSTQPWYYLSLIALVALCIDMLFGALIKTAPLRLVRASVLLMVVALTYPIASNAVRTRLTNIDIVAAHLNIITRPKDVIIVNDWYYGITFHRYYSGPSQWMTVPVIGFHEFHRFDILKTQMETKDQTEPVRLAFIGITNALRSGNRVYLVGKLEDPGNRPVRILSAAPTPGSRWPEGAYRSQWSGMVSGFLARHATSITSIPLTAQAQVSRLETVSLFSAKGWREPIDARQPIEPTDDK